MEKKHLGYSDNLLIRVIKSQESDLKNQKPLDKKSETYEADQAARAEALTFYKECLEEAKARGIVKVVSAPKVEAPVEQKKEDDASK